MCFWKIIQRSFWVAETSSVAWMDHFSVELVLLIPVLTVGLAIVIRPVKAPICPMQSTPE